MAKGTPVDVGLAALLGTGWASGINLYATVAALGLLGRYADIAEIPDTLQSWPVIAVATAAFLIEFVADKVPYLDNVWDLVHTFVRPIGAAAIGASLASDTDVSTIVAMLTAGGAALGSHATKAGARIAVNTSPEPVSNIAVSLFEDGLVVGMVWLVTEQPLLAGILAVVLLVAGVAVLTVAYRVIRAGVRRLRGRRGGTAAPGGTGVRPPVAPGSPRTGP